MNKQKLELTWFNKEVRPRLEPRVLIFDASLSHYAAKRNLGVSFDNRLIFGDNLLALRALESEFSGKLKCIFIDPPYNTGAAFAQYDDGIEHSIWLGLMRDRLEVLKRLMRPDGSIWVTLDDVEAHYLKVLGDEVFGRECFIADIAWQKRDGPPNDRKIGSIHDHILIWGKQKPLASKKTLAEESFNLMARTEKADAQYQVYDEPSGPDSRGAFRKIDTTANGKGGRMVDSLLFPIRNPYTGQDVYPRKGTCWRHNKEEMQRLQQDGRLYWGVKGTATTPMRKLFKTEAKNGMSSPSIWTELALNQHASQEMEELFGEKASFETPKPEKLLERILSIATNPGDWVLDSFAGSGTTGAVAHKMGRQWIMIEMGEHCHTHIIPRMQKVIDGTDMGGISQAINWKGGGGFRYYRLAPSLIKQDSWGNPVINPQFNPELTAEAVCKLEGFTYAPSDTDFWRHGQSTETDFIYVTTQTLSPEQLDRISDEVGPKRSLLVCCGAWRAKDLTRWGNLTLKKIPKAVLDRADWDHDDYSLAVSQLPVVEEEAEVEEAEPTVKTAKVSKGEPVDQGDLFSAKPKPAGTPKRKK